MGELAVGARVDRLEADPPISVASVDLTMVDPGRVRLELDARADSWQAAADARGGALLVSVEQSSSNP
jgi:hypothetical protein